ncbi:hybrid sensor histidine kinase/response regulator [Phenylobacterium sp. J426]|uniref:hybrid sensor histidine kinase/response regulator n=1 Tax=Phenylobacterium sp. J426 TaxID=2898439 RepID=UPI002150F18E|nr:hybrid sensor histidine kinase/response regulator [Phenylobacterium sp. J426]MCR5875310.1 hybrid sensor histidine kinase/response regulator [Phenylobacterium sp. J426]
MSRARIAEDVGGLSVNEQGMKAQAALLPYALAAFGVCLPVFVWAGSHAANAAWMSATFALFAMGWGAFYGVVNWLKTQASHDLRRRARVQVLGGLIWAGAIAQLAIFADGAGPAREALVLMSLAAALISVFFAAPWLPSLLIVAPAALAGPLVVLFSRSQDAALAKLGLAATALALALALLVNRILRSQYGLAAEREQLIAERAEQAEAARRLARAKTDLVATLSDEIRNGLNGVAHMLASAAGPGGRAAPSRQQLAAARDAVEDLLSVLETTVDAETAEAGALSVEPRPVDLIAIARDLVLQHRPAAAAKGLEIGLHIDGEAPGAAIADPARIRQVLAALIGNAVKFTVRGRVEARISAEGGRIAVAVADTGPGLNEEELAIAMQPFRRVARTSAGAPGAGLGLPLACRLAGLMGGEVRAQSAPGVGSCFVVELPYDAAAAPPARDAVSAAEAEPRRLRVLIACEQALNAAMLRATLEQLGHQVVQAADADRAVELARVCNLDMAFVERPAAVAALRGLAADAGKTPVIALIEGGGADEADACRAAGADALLRKPVAAPAAARAIAEALSARTPANDRAVA